jgi:hypothetical protein
MHNLSDIQFSNRISWYKKYLAKVRVPKEFLRFHGRIFNLSALFLNHLDDEVYQDHAFEVMLNILDDIFFEYSEKYDASLSKCDNNLISQYGLNPKRQTKKDKLKGESEKEQLSLLNKKIDSYAYHTDAEEKFEDIKNILSEFSN